MQHGFEGLVRARLVAVDLLLRAVLAERVGRVVARDGGPFLLERRESVHIGQLAFGRRREVLLLPVVRA